MAGNGLPLIEGIGVSVRGDLQAAIDQAGKRYHEKHGLTPTHVALPPGADPATVNLWTLNLARAAGARVVIVGRPIGDNGTPARQLELL